jgi:Serine dehydrogenase proteinase
MVSFPSQTPLFYASNRDRYERQNMIKQIEELTQRTLVVYISNFNHPLSSITRDDIVPFAEVCYGIEKGAGVDLIIHSPGGDPNAAEQMVNILLAKTDDIRVIVPQSAKSAATMISLVANEILMSDSSELGPIDPQIPIMTHQGPLYRPAKAILNGLQKIMQDTIDNNNNLNPTYYPILQGIDAALIDHCEKSIQHSINLAKKWLQRSMCSDESIAMSIAKQLVDIEKFPNHGAVIDWREAKNLGLNVTYLPQDDELWQGIWRLFCMYAVDLKSKELVKFFESNKYSVSI